MILVSPVSARSSARSRSASHCDSFFGHLVVFLVRLLGLVPGVLELLLQVGHPLLVLYALVLHHVPHSGAVVGSGGGFVQLGVGDQEALLGLLQVFFKSLDATVEGVDLGLGSQQSLFLLFQLQGDYAEALVGHVQLGLELLGLLDELVDLLLGLLGADLGRSGSLLAGIAPVHGVVLLHLHGLHLLFDG